MDTQTALSPTQTDETANAIAITTSTTNASTTALEPQPSNEDLLPFYLLAMAGAY